MSPVERMADKVVPNTFPLPPEREGRSAPRGGEGCGVRVGLHATGPPLALRACPLPLRREGERGISLTVGPPPVTLIDTIRSRGIQ